MSNKILIERLNSKLDELEVPPLLKERVQVCTKLFNLPAFKIESLLNGITIQDHRAVQVVADTLEVSPDWLTGRTTKNNTH